MLKKLKSISIPEIKTIVVNGSYVNFEIGLYEKSALLIQNSPGDFSFHKSTLIYDIWYNQQSQKITSRGNHETIIKGTLSNVKSISINNGTFDLKNLSELKKLKYLFAQAAKGNVSNIPKLDYCFITGNQVTGNLTIIGDITDRINIIDSGLNGWLSKTSRPKIIELTENGGTSSILFDMDYMFSPAFEAMDIYFESSTWNSAMVDKLLNNMKSSITTRVTPSRNGNSISIYVGANRTSKSNAAVAYLTSLGFSVNV